MKRSRHHALRAIGATTCAGFLFLLIAPLADAQAAAPGAPTITSVTSGNKKAEVAWSAPASDGGSPITGYVVTPFRGATQQKPISFGADATKGTVTGLANNATYTFRVAAVNAAGTGPMSAPSNAVKPKGPGTSAWYKQKRVWAVGLVVIAVIAVVGFLVLRRPKPGAPTAAPPEPASSSEDVS
jgi:hypothetical protein